MLKNKFLLILFIYSSSTTCTSVDDDWELTNKEELQEFIELTELKKEVIQRDWITITKNSLGVNAIIFEEDEPNSDKTTVVLHDPKHGIRLSPQQLNELYFGDAETVIRKLRSGGRKSK